MENINIDMIEKMLIEIEYKKMVLYVKTVIDEFKVYLIQKAYYEYTFGANLLERRHIINITYLLQNSPFGEIVCIVYYPETESIKCYFKNNIGFIDISLEGFIGDILL